MKQRTELRFFLKPTVNIVMSLHFVIQCSSILKEKLSHLDRIKMTDNYIHCIDSASLPLLHQTQLHRNSSK